MSTIIADNLTGKTSAGDITVTSEGGAATQSLQQGLAKAWIDLNGTGTIATRNSFSVSSISDIGTGHYTSNFSNGFANVNFTSEGSASTSSSNSNGIWTSASGTATTTSRNILTMNTTGTVIDCQFAQGSFNGDLA